MLSSAESSDRAASEAYLYSLTRRSIWAVRSRRGCASLWGMSETNLKLPPVTDGGAAVITGRIAGISGGVDYPTLPKHETPPFLRPFDHHDRCGSDREPRHPSTPPHVSLTETVTTNPQTRRAQVLTTQRVASLRSYP
jgi:hypothetical protein